VGRVAIAARMPARSGDASDAGHRTGAATKTVPGAAATLLGRHDDKAAHGFYLYGTRGCFGPIIVVTSLLLSAADPPPDILT